MSLLKLDFSYIFPGSTYAACMFRLHLMNISFSTEILKVLSPGKLIVARCTLEARSTASYKTATSVNLPEEPTQTVLSGPDARKITSYAPAVIEL